MNARDIEIFRAVMHCRSLSAAARMLNVSQPALSQSVRHCEDRLGFALFHRHAGRLKPTVEAQALWPEAERLFQELQSFKGLARDLGSGRGGLLRLGATSSLGVSLVPRAIAVLRRERQSARLAVHLLPVRELTEALLMRRLDVGLSLSAVVVPGLEATTLGSVPCVVVLPESHPLAAQPALRPSLLANVPEIGFAGWQDFGRSLDLVFEAEGVQRQLAVEVGTTVSAIAMVREGIGFAIVDGLAKDGLPPGVVARPFLPEVRRDIVLARSSELGTSSLVDRLCGILTDLAVRRRAPGERAARPLGDAPPLAVQSKRAPLARTTGSQ